MPLGVSGECSRDRKCGEAEAVDGNTRVPERRTTKRKGHKSVQNGETCELCVLSHWENSVLFPNREK